jgi:uncharacterized YigZ family protein
VSPPPPDVATITSAVRVEIEKIKSSRFICDLAPVGDAGSALHYVERVRAVEPGATHHCWAYRLGSGDSRSSDDGEPSGTAGPPILRRIETRDLIDVVAVVTRYHGGTNLGTGGLIRAYGSAAAAAIDAAHVVGRPRTATFRLGHPYELSGAVGRVLSLFDVEVTHSRYEESVTLEVRVRAERSSAFTAGLRDETAGVVIARPIPD